MRLEVVQRLAEVGRESWNSLRGTDNPFLSHEFLSALEAHHCVEPETGWQPWHLLVYEGERLLAAAPAYLKGHSWGEFVFDWSWAQAHENRGIAYYPKLICAVPYSPVTGPRVLLAEGADDAIFRILAVAARRIAQENGLSSVHWLFPHPQQAQALAACGYALRHGCQFHWRNGGYRDFSDFLAALNSKKRKNIRQERAGIAAREIRFDRIPGDRVDSETWAFFHAVYADTFARHNNLPPLPLGFFEEIGQSMGDRIVLILGHRAGSPVSAALCLRSPRALYGRYWGAIEDIPGLHFETCYYQGIEYCIEQGLELFEPGAQGEHKLARGFLPTTTYSAHWIADPSLRLAIDDFLRREQSHVQAYSEELSLHSPFRDA